MSEDKESHLVLYDFIAEEEDEIDLVKGEVRRGPLKYDCTEP